MLLGHLRDRPLIGFAENRDHLLLGESGLLHGSLQTPRAPFSQALGGPKIARQVNTVNIVRDQMTDRARGFAFVEMQFDEDPQNAIQRLDDAELDGRKLAVNKARPKPASGSAARRLGARAALADGGTARPPFPRQLFSGLHVAAFPRGRRSAGPLVIVATSRRCGGLGRAVLIGIGGLIVLAGRRA